jgi:putative endonuclease
VKNSHNKEIGKLGEDVAERFLVKREFKVVERNYLRKWGEIDIVALKEGVTHFIEVKTVSRDLKNVIHETLGYRPEDNVHFDKMERMSRIIQTYIIEKMIEEGKWQFDVLTILLDRKNKLAKVEFLEDIIL